MTERLPPPPPPPLPAACDARRRLTTTRCRTMREKERVRESMEVQVTSSVCAVPACCSRFVRVCRGARAACADSAGHSGCQRCRCVEDLDDRAHSNKFLYPPARHATTTLASYITTAVHHHTTRIRLHQPSHRTTTDRTGRRWAGRFGSRVITHSRPGTMLHASLTSSRSRCRPSPFPHPPKARS